MYLLLKKLYKFHTTSLRSRTATTYQRTPLHFTQSNRWKPYVHLIFDITQLPEWVKPSFPNCTAQTCTQNNSLKLKHTALLIRVNGSAE